MSLLAFICFIHPPLSNLSTLTVFWSPQPPASPPTTNESHWAFSDCTGTLITKSLPQVPKLKTPYQSAICCITHFSFLKVDGVERIVLLVCDCSTTMHGKKNMKVAIKGSCTATEHWEKDEYIIFTPSSPFFRLLLLLHPKSSNSFRPIKELHVKALALFLSTPESCYPSLWSAKDVKGPVWDRRARPLTPTSKQTNKRHNQEWNLKAHHAWWVKWRENSRTKVFLLLMSLSVSETVQG